VITEAEALQAVAAVAKRHDPGAVVFVGAREFPGAVQRPLVTVVVQTSVNNHAMIEALAKFEAEHMEDYQVKKSQVVQYGEVPVDLIEVEAKVAIKF